MSWNLCKTAARNRSFVLRRLRRLGHRAIGLLQECTWTTCGARTHRLYRSPGGAAIVLPARMHKLVRGTELNDPRFAAVHVGRTVVVSVHLLPAGQVSAEEHAASVAALSETILKLGVGASS